MPEAISESTREAPPAAALDTVGEQTLEIFQENDGYSNFLWESLLALSDAPLRGRILEVGCGIGNLTRLLLKEEPVTFVHAIDLDATYTDRVRRELPDERLTLSATSAEEFCPSEYQGEGHGFDRIVCINVLEHIEDHLRVLTNFRRLLCPGGLALMLVPAHPSLYCDIDRGLSHFRRYGRGDFAELAKSSGLLLKAQRHFNPLGAFPGLVA